MRRRVTFEDDLWRRPPGSSSPRPEINTIANAVRASEENEEESLDHLPSQPRDSDQSDTDDSGVTGNGDLQGATRTTFRDQHNAIPVIIKTLTADRNPSTTDTMTFDTPGSSAL